MIKSKSILVCGAGGFIGGHLVNRLSHDGHRVVGADLKLHEYCKLECDNFLLGDLRDFSFCAEVFSNHYDEVYQLAADMGGAGYVFTGDNDADVMCNSSQINLNIARLCVEKQAGRVFYSSSACIYPEYNQLDPENPDCSEDSAYPADPDSEYGWEKLFSERLYLAFARNYGLEVRIARYHNIFGPFGAWQCGKEKVPAAICRKVAQASDDGRIEIWGDGQQTRSFLYIDECLEATTRLMASAYGLPVNIGSEEMISIDRLAEMVMLIADKPLMLDHIEGPLGVRGRVSNNSLIRQVLGWEPSMSLRKGLEPTYRWISEQVAAWENPAE